MQFRFMFLDVLTEALGMQAELGGYFCRSLSVSFQSGYGISVFGSSGRVKTDKGGVMSHQSMGKYAEALQLYSTTTESIKSLARRFGFNDCAFGQFIRRHFPELHEQHKELVRQMKEAD